LKNKSIKGFCGEYLDPGVIIIMGGEGSTLRNLIACVVHLYSGWLNIGVI
jgi:hypothetical protein